MMRKGILLKKKLQKPKWCIDNCEVLECIKTEFLWDSTNTATNVFLSILTKKIVDVTIILSENREDENRYLSDTSLAKICGMETDCV